MFCDHTIEDKKNVGSVNHHGETFGRRHLWLNDFCKYMLEVFIPSVTEGATHLEQNVFYMLQDFLGFESRWIFSYFLRLLLA